MDGLTLYDFDGTLATAAFSKSPGSIMPCRNTFKDYFPYYTDGHTPYENQLPNHEMQEIIADKVARYRRIKSIGHASDIQIGVLSACRFGSLEIFAKIDFLEKYYHYDEIDWKKHFIGVPSEADKADALWTMYRKHGFVTYVDDSLESLISIEKAVRDRFKSELMFSKMDSHPGINLYHLTTYVELNRKKEEVPA